MPYVITQISKRRYKVSNPKTGRVYSKKTTYQKAQAQVHLLRAIDKNTNAWYKKSNRTMRRTKPQ